MLSSYPEYYTNISGNANTYDGSANFWGYENKYQHGYVSPAYFWRGRKLAMETVYDKDGNKVKKTLYQYQDWEKEHIFDMPVFRYGKSLVRIDDASTSGNTKDKQEIVMLHPNKCTSCLEKSFAIKHQKYVVGVEKLVKEIDSVFVNGQAIVTVKAYNYEQPYYLPSEEQITNSDGKVIKTVYKYPFHFNSTPYTNMASKNILSPIIEQTEYRNNVFTQKKITDYKNWGNDLFAPEYIRQQTAGQSNPETRIAYYTYDLHGNPCYITKDDADKVVYLWGYNYQYSIAEIKNATYEQIKNSLGQTLIDRVAGANTPSVADVNTINNLRFNANLSNSQITTYEYKPLVGMTKQTNPQGVVTTYEYDSFGRLQTVKDHNGNKLEGYDYHYKTP